MARPTKNNAEYFQHYTTMRNHRKVKILRNKFGSILGYAFWSMMLEWLTEQDGLEWEYSELECEMFAAELGVSAAEIRSLVDFCLQIELLFKSDTGFVYSESLNELMQPLFDKRQRERDKSKTRKRRESGQFGNDNTASGGVSAAETPQRRVEDSRVDKSRAEDSKEEQSKKKIAPPEGDGFFDAEELEEEGGLRWDQSYLNLPKQPEEEKEKGSAEKEKEEARAAEVLSRSQYESKYKDRWWQFYKEQNNGEEPLPSLRTPKLFGPIKKIQQDLAAVFDGDQERAYQEFVYILEYWPKLNDYHRHRLMPDEIHKSLRVLRRYLNEERQKSQKDYNKIPVLGEALEIFREAHLTHRELQPNINEARDLPLLGQTLEYLKGLQPERTWQDALTAFEFICQGWPVLEAQDKFYETNFTIRFIHGNTASIIGKFKQRQHKQPDLSLDAAARWLATNGTHR